MAFGWFSRGKESEDKRIFKARKLESQGRWAEALSYYEEILEGDGGNEDATRGDRLCRERLVEANLEEARAFQASDPEKARDHARLALDLAGGETDLRGQAQAFLDVLRGPPEAPRPKASEAPSRLFEPTCSCAAPCDEATCESEEGAEDEDLFSLYLDAADPQEREAIELLGQSFREGYVLLHQGDLIGARESLTEALREETDTAGVHYALGLVEGLEGHLAEAGACFTRALEGSPDFAPAAWHRAAVLREMDRAEQAAVFLRSWLGPHPDDGEALLLLAGCSLDAGDLAEARRLTEEAGRKLGGADARPGLLAAVALRRAGDRAQALRILQGILAPRPELLDALVPMGEMLVEQGGASAERAAEVFKRCYQLDPDRGWWYLLRIAEAYGVRGWKTEARDVLERARSELPDAADARAAWDAVEGKLV